MDCQPRAPWFGESMNVLRPPAWALCFALIALGIVFVFLPSGWNLIPLFFIALVILALSVQWRTARCKRGENTEERRPTGESLDEGMQKSEFGHGQDPELAWRLNHAFGPIAAGMVIDLVDFATFGPIGLVLGLPIGGLAGYWMGRAIGLSRRASVWCAMAAGIYCTIPGTEFIPLATIVGACVRFREGRMRQKTDETGGESRATRNDGFC